MLVTAKNKTNASLCKFKHYVILNYNHKIRC